MKRNESMFNSDLTPMFDGAILMNEEAMKDEAVMMALRRAHQDMPPRPPPELQTTTSKDA